MHGTNKGVSVGDLWSIHGDHLFATFLLLMAILSQILSCVFYSFRYANFTIEMCKKDRVNFYFVMLCQFQ